MFDLGLLTIPAIAASAAFVLAVFSGEDIAIEKINVSHQLEWSGYDSTIVTRQFTDELRELNVSASSELTGIEVDGTSMEKSVSAFEEYFELGLIVNGTRNLFGLIPYYINGEITEDRGEATFNVRIYTKDEEKPVRLVTVKGDPENLTPLLHEGALAVVEQINPYVAALYQRKLETAAGEFEYTGTRAVLDRFLATRPVEEHYLAYGLLGRMHMLKAERDSLLTPEEREREYDIALGFLHAALRQQTEFLFPIINLAIIHNGRGETDLADQYFAHAVHVNPNHLLTRQLWGDALAEQNRFGEAVLQYVAAVELAPEDASLRDSLARTYEALGHTEAAREQWLEALRLDPTNDAIKAELDLLPVGVAGAAVRRAG